MAIKLSVPTHSVRLPFRKLQWRSGMTNSRYRWVIVAAGGLLGCVAIGGMFSLPVFLQPIARDTGWSVTGVSSAMTIGFLAMAFTSMIWGTLSDRLGPLPVVLTGSIVLAASLALASLATSLVAFQFIFGLMVGAACAAIFAPMMACVTGWFDTHHPHRELRHQLRHSVDRRRHHLQRGRFCRIGRPHRIRPAR